MRFSFPLALTAALCLPGTAQTQGTQPPAATSSSTSAASSNDVASLYGTPVEQIVARVNDRVITNSDITRAQQQLDQEARQSNWNLTEYDQHEKNLLRDLIDMQLLLSKGKQMGITGDTEMIKRLDEVRKQNHLDSLDDLEKAVEQQGISYEDFKANIRNSIVTQQVVRDEVGSKLQISQAEIEKYYNDHKDSFTQPESIHLNEILIPTSDNPSNADLQAAEAKANDVEAKLKAGGKFTDLAKKYSGGPTAQEGGDLGNFRRGALAKVLEQQTFDLAPGSYTQPIRTKQGYIILQVTDHTPGGVAPLQKVEPQIEEAIYEQKIQPAVRRYLTRLRNEAYIDIRPGYTDAASSPDETKPTFTAYAPPQPKKKKKKSRFDRRYVGNYRYAEAQRQRAAAAEDAAASTAQDASGELGKETSAGVAPISVGPAPASAAKVKKASARKAKSAKVKREKIRFGRAPQVPVSEEQVASASGETQKTSSTQATGVAADAAGGSDAQPLGPDLEHNPTITTSRVEKRRFSDEARNKAELAAKKSQKKKTKGQKKAQKQAKKVKKNNTTPTPLSPTEVANQKVQSAPLGLEGATADKKKKKKKVAVNGQKTRLSDEKKDKKAASQTQPANQDYQTPASTDNGTSAPPTPSGTSPQQP